MKKNIPSNESFEFINGAEKITFEILTGNKYLEINKTTNTKFTFENIDPQICAFVGPTVTFSNPKSSNQNEILIDISPTEDHLKNGEIQISVSYKSKGELQWFKIVIPLKK
ncbi:hypothetical protein [Flavobacterium sp.]|jgi:hypothetical protein|uniref:hypothetical protein n=1 Tax=Flavobacterium sp. TaxID=239 RepID=UPI002A80B37D|nr:hypothetical protein [Flavobacterium sp.]